MQGSGCRVQGAGFRVQGSGCRVQGAGFRVQGKAKTDSNLADGGGAHVAPPGADSSPREHGADQLRRRPAQPRQRQLRLAFDRKADVCRQREREDVDGPGERRTLAQHLPDVGEK